MNDYQYLIHGTDVYIPKIIFDGSNNIEAYSYTDKTVLVRTFGNPDRCSLTGVTIKNYEYIKWYCIEADDSRLQEIYKVLMVKKEIGIIKQHSTQNLRTFMTLYYEPSDN